MSNFKKLSDFVAATEINPNDLFMIVDVAANETKNVTLSVIKTGLSFSFNTDDIVNESTVPGATLTDTLDYLLTHGGGGSVPPEVTDLVGRYAEGYDYIINRDAEGFVSTIVTNFSLTSSKTWTFTRDLGGLVQTINIHKSDNTYNKTYTFNRDLNGFVSTISIS